MGRSTPRHSLTTTRLLALWVLVGLGGCHGGGSRRFEDQDNAAAAAGLGGSAGAMSAPAQGCTAGQYAGFSSGWLGPAGAASSWFVQLTTSVRLADNGAGEFVATGMWLGPAMTGDRFATYEGELSGTLDCVTQRLSANVVGTLDELDSEELPAPTLVVSGTYGAAQELPVIQGEWQTGDGTGSGTFSLGFAQLPIGLAP